MTSSTPSRRAALAALAGAIPVAGVLRGAGLWKRALVCIRLVDGLDAAGILEPGGGLTVASESQQRVGLHASLSGMRRLFDQRSVALIQESPDAAVDRDYVQGGFTAPGWMLRAAGANVLRSAGSAFPFRSGLLVLTPGKSLQSVLTPAATEALDNPEMLAHAQLEKFSFPDTPLGRQLRQAAGILASSSGQMMAVASLAGSVTIGDAETQRAARLRQLDQALAAFQAALEGLNIAPLVTTFTDSDTVAAAPRIVMGWAVAGGQIYSASGQERAGATLARWAGYRSEQLLPGAAPLAAEFLR